MNIKSWVPWVNDDYGWCYTRDTIRSRVIYKGKTIYEEPGWILNLYDFNRSFFRWLGSA